MKHGFRSCLLLAFALAGSAPADVVVMTDGSRLVGKVKEVANGKLKIETQIAGTLELDATKVVSLSTDAPVHVKFRTGDVLVGKVQTDATEQESKIDTSLGLIAVPVDQLATLWNEGEQDPEVAARIAAVQAERDSFLPKWTLTLEGSASRTEGNTDTLAGRGRLDLLRKTPLDSLRFYLMGTYAEEDKERSTNEQKAGTRYDYKLTKHWDWYARGELEHDEFEDLDLRATAASGVAYRWIDEETHFLRTSVGLGYRHESYEDDTTKNQAIADLGLDYRLDIKTWMQFVQSTSYSPDIEDFGDYRLTLDTALLFPLKDERFKLKVGMLNEYNSRPVGGTERLDNTYYTSVLVEIK